jgi:hypothetical protein
LLQHLVSPLSVSSRTVVIETSLYYDTRSEKHQEIYRLKIIQYHVNCRDYIDVCKECAAENLVLAVKSHFT